MRTIGTDWREYGATFEIEHHSELLARLLDTSSGGPGAASREVVFHDPCYLGRYRNVYDEPREVIAPLGRRGGPAARARALLLLRRRRRPDVPGRGEGQARQRGARRGTGATGAQDHCHGLPLLPDDVPRRAGRRWRGTPPKLLDIAQIAAARAAAGAAEKRIVTSAARMI